MVIAEDYARALCRQDLAKLGTNFYFRCQDAQPNFISLLSVKRFGRDTGSSFKISLLIIGAEMSHDPKTV
jgi:hypothetical protein